MNDWIPMALCSARSAKFWYFVGEIGNFPYGNRLKNDTCWEFWMLPRSEFPECWWTEDFFTRFYFFTRFSWSQDSQEPSIFIFLLGLNREKKTLDFIDFSEMLPRLESHNFRATELFLKSRHSRIIYWLQFVHFCRKRFFLASLRYPTAHLSEAICPNKNMHSPSKRRVLTWSGKNRNLVNSR